MSNKGVTFSCQDPPKFTKSVSFPSAFHQLSVSFSCHPFSLTRFGATDILQARVLVELSGELDVLEGADRHDLPAAGFQPTLGYFVLLLPGLTVYYE